MSSIQEIQHESQFTALRESWSDLLQQSESNNPFLSWPWLHTWWKVYGGNSFLRILLLHHNSKIVAIAPFISSVVRVGLIKFVKISFLGSHGVASDYLDIISFKGFEKLALVSIYEYLAKQKAFWDVIQLDSLPQYSKTLVLSPSITRSLGHFSITSHSITCPLIQLPPTWEDYLSSVSKSMRYSIQRSVRKISKKYLVRYETVRDHSSLQDAMGDLSRLNRWRLKSKHLHGAFRDSTFTQFHERVAQLLFQSNKLDLSFLNVDNQRIAALYNFIYNDRCYHYQSGFDPRWSKYSPGKVIFAFSIKEAINNNFKEYDLLRGVEDYKFSWVNTTNLCFTNTIFNRSVKGLLLYSYHLVKTHMKKTAAFNNRLDLYPH
jgi:hypothetical protein